MECLASLTELRRCTQTGRAVDVRTSIRPIPWWLPELTGQKTGRETKRREISPNQLRLLASLRPVLIFATALLNSWKSGGMMVVWLQLVFLDITRSLSKLILWWWALFFFCRPPCRFSVTDNRSLSSKPATHNLWIS